MNRFIPIHRISWLACGIVAVAFIATTACSQDKTTAPKKAATTTLKASNVVRLRQNVGKEVTIVGKVAATNKSSSGHQFLNFNGRDFTIICMKDDVAKFKPLAPADAFKNKHIEITGKLENFKGKLQIKLTDPAQIKEVEAPKSASSSPKGVELKEVGKNVWMSPAGLRFAGRDPQGLTRVEHIMRHVQDQPKRDGPHGVFDGGKGVAFAVIDQAWQLAEKKKLKSRREGDRSTYLVYMNRRVGYLGGSTGKQRGNPPLTKVFIVFETDTKNIITAFPR